MSTDIVNISSIKRFQQRAVRFVPAYMDADILKAWTVEVLAELIGRRRLSYEDIGQTVGKSKQAVWTQLTTGKPSSEMIDLLVTNFNIPRPSTSGVDKGPLPQTVSTEPKAEQEEGVIVTRRLYETVLHDNEHLRDLSDRILRLLEQKLGV